MSVDRDALQARLRSLFLDELDQHVVILNRGLVAIEQGSTGAGFTELVNEMFRSAHSLKGASQVVAVEAVATLCHALESALGRLRDGGVASAAGEGLELDTMFQAVDMLSSAGRQLREGGDVSDLPVAGVVRALSRQTADTDDKAAEVPPASPPPPRPEASYAAPAPDGVEPAATEPSERPAQAGIRVPAARLEALLNRAGEVLLACEPMQAVAAEAGSAEAAAAARVLASAQQALTDALRQAGMVPFSEACTGLDRVSRDVARAAAKQVRLGVHGGDVEMDRPIVEGLRELLVHLVRNAVDHGIEIPEARVTAGKPPVGTLDVTASLHGTRVEVTVSDDGRGIDAERVREAATRRGIGEPAEREGDSLLDLVFAPGLSTAPLITEVSGRGVGLDAVRAGVEALGGSVSIESHAGAGACVTLLVPVTRSVIRVLLVVSGGQVLALPTSGVVRIVRGRSEDLRVTGDRTTLLVDGHLLPVAWLSDALGMETGPADPGPSLQAVVVDTPGGQAVLVVDQLLAEQEAVIKPPPARLAGLAGVLGATILPDGRVVLVLNPATSVRTAMGRGRAMAPPSAAEAAVRRRRILLADDTLTTRTLERSILETAGYDVVAAVDGQHALELLQAQAELGVDAVVSDVNMPRMDGLALCEAVRSSNRFADLPVVLVTSLASDEDRRRGVEAGADAYIAKSEFDQSMLLDTLARLL